MMRVRYMKYAFLFTANDLHFSIMNKFYFYFLRGGYGVFFAPIVAQKNKKIYKIHSKFIHSKFFDKLKA